jgi:hypothetical protein
MAEPDANKKALDQVEKVTESAPVLMSSNLPVKNRFTQSNQLLQSAATRLAFTFFND